MLLELFTIIKYHFIYFYNNNFVFQYDSLKEVARMEKIFNKLSEKHKNKLKFDFNERINNVKLAI